MQTGPSVPEWWLQAQFVAPLFGVLGGALGFLVERYSDFRKSPDRLREDLKKGVLGTYGRRRLVPSAEADLQRFCAEFQEPSQVLLKALGESSDKLIGLPADFNAWLSGGSGGNAVPSVRPILIFLASEGVTSLRIATDFVSELKQVLDNKISAAATFREMLRLNQPAQTAKLKALIAVPNLLVRSPEGLQDILRRLVGALREYLGPASVGLVFLAAADVRRTLAATRDPDASVRDDSVQPAVPAAKPVSQAHEYNRFREQFFSMLQQGWHGRRHLVRESGMSDLVEARLADAPAQDLKSIVSRPEDFTTAGIWGPPGSGKTALALLIADRMITESAAVVLEVSHEDLAARFTNAGDWSREQANTILGTLAYDLLPRGGGEEFGQRERAFQDAWLSLLDRRRPTVVLLIDDLYASSETRKLCAVLRPAADRLALKLIVVDRVHIRPTAVNERIFLFECRLWTRSESERLLAKWVPAEVEVLLRSEMSRGWLKDQNQFSSYLLEVVAQNLGNLQADDTEKLLRETMRAQTERVLPVLGGTRSVPQELLGEIRQLLLANEPRDLILQKLEAQPELDPVVLLGQISWFNQFTHEVSSFGVQDVIGWSAGQLTMTEPLAEQVLSACHSASIFRSDESRRYLWSNPLVRDGCAALYLRHQFTRMKPLTIAEMVRRLHKVGSVEILTLALDVEMLLRIIDAIGATADIAGDLVDRLVTGQLISRLAHDSGNRDRLIDYFKRFVSKADDEYGTAACLSGVLGQLVPLSPELETYIDQVVGYDGPQGTLAVAVFCARYIDSPAFFEKLWGVRSDLVPLEIAVRLWTITGARALFDALAAWHTGGGPKTVERLCHKFCDRQPASTLDGLLSLLLEEKWFRSQTEEFSVIVFRVVFSALRNTHKRSPAPARPQALRALGIAAVARGWKSVAAETARWISLYVDSDLTSMESEWVCYSVARAARRSPSNEEVMIQHWYAIPRAASEPATVPSILQRTMQEGPVKLASVEDLKAAGVVIGSRELTRDRLPKGYKAGDPYSPAWLATWDGAAAETGFLDATIFHLHHDKIAWRPRVSLTEDAGS